MPGKKEKKKTEIDQPLVEGVFMFANKDKYDGQYCLSDEGFIVRNGKGEHTSADGTVYKGRWENDKMCGIGEVFHPSGASYYGDFVDNMMHGHGKYTWPDGSFYEGPFYENKMEGEGQFQDSIGQIWTGNFKGQSAANLKFKLNM